MSQEKQDRSTLAEASNPGDNFILGLTCNEVRIIDVISQATFTKHNYCIGPHSQLKWGAKCY